MTKYCMNRRKEKSLSDITCHWWSLIIPVGSHRQHICSSFAARMWWAEAAYPLITHISALFIHLLPDPSYAQKFFVPENLQGERVSFLCLFFPLLYKVLCVPTAIPGHYISFSMLLYQTMTSACSNCFQTRQGLSFHFIFRFLAQVQSQQKQIMRNGAWCHVDRACSAKILWPLVSRKLSFPCRFLCCLFLYSVFLHPLQTQVFFFFSSDDIQVLYLWESTWLKLLCVTDLPMPLWPCPMCNVSVFSYTKTRRKRKRREGSETAAGDDRVGAEMQRDHMYWVEEMAFYEQKVGLCLEFSMTSFWSRALCSRDSGDGVGLHQTGRLDWIVTVEGEEREAEAGRQRELHRLTKYLEVWADFYSSALPGFF